MTGTDGPSRLATRATASMLGLHQLHQQLNYSTWATLLNKGMACTGLVRRVLKKVSGSDNVMFQQTGCTVHTLLQIHLYIVCQRRIMNKLKKEFVKVKVKILFAWRRRPQQLDSRET